VLGSGCPSVQLAKHPSDGVGVFWKPPPVFRFIRRERRGPTRVDVDVKFEQFFKENRTVSWIELEQELLDGRILASLQFLLEL
jgi:hypothetical protein